MMAAFLEKGILLVLRVPIAREEMRLPERKKSPVLDHFSRWFLRLLHEVKPARQHLLLRVGTGHHRAFFWVLFTHWPVLLSASARMKHNGIPVRRTTLRGGEFASQPDNSHDKSGSYSRLPAPQAWCPAWGAGIPINSGARKPLSFSQSVV